jgi:hypothetical protein
MNISKASINDINDTFNHSLENELLKGSWIYSVDPETYKEVQNFWREEAPGTYSLYDSFCHFLYK